ncbi:TIGR04500 family putative peptide maturation system protein [Hyalangium versicolor]|uniref:TIGR04500 family putative peptide maturation system protein n=1 Tax=Hyalangium versicolor TaxID=2861190 RepID=UPI001CC99B2F|nr:TIGR04500 family putative peptide maturation system protein [Hyalangium versicolor]
MNSDINQTILGVLEEMIRLAREPAAPGEGEARLKRRVQEHTGRKEPREAEPRTPVKLDVLWDQESVTGAVHYDALLRVPGWGSVSIGYCPEHGLPWALRGTFRWSEVDMLRVNQRRIGVADVVTQLDFLWAEPWLARQLVDSVLITDAIEEEPDAFTASDEELQAAMDAFRRRRGLLSEVAMMQWIEQQGLTQRNLETRLEGFVKIRKLRQRVVAGREEAYFASHKSEFEVAVIARIVLGTPERARSLYERLLGGKVDLLQAAMEALREQTPSPHRWESPPPLLERVRRSALPSEQAGVVFAATPGTVLEPLETKAGYELQQVLAIEPAVFDSATRAAIGEHLFQEWLAERRAAADVEWLWGHS